MATANPQSGYGNGAWTVGPDPQLKLDTGVGALLICYRAMSAESPISGRLR
jgi:hypothetical protein